MLWLHLEQKSDGLHAFGYDFSVRDELRRQGYGRAVMVAAEAVCRDRGVVSVGLNVFGFNEGARALYEQMGFETAAILMRKQLERVSEFR
jgi:GNAT superfamily N-acetyltransferase